LNLAGKFNCNRLHCADGYSSAKSKEFVANLEVKTALVTIYFCKDVTDLVEEN
jgi:hypothetical protein